MAKLLKFDQEALHSLKVGVESLSQAVTVTLGPKGRNVLLQQMGSSPLSTKDGVSVAKDLEVKDPFENLAIQVLKEASSKTADIAGDGTTTAIVLAAAIFAEGMQNIAAGASPMGIKRGIDKAVGAIELELNALARNIDTPEKIKQIATISSNNDQSIGQIIAEAMEKVGREGTITLQEGQSLETTLEVVEGMQFDKGYISPYFVNNNEKMRAELENCRILVTDGKISSAKDLATFLEKTMHSQRPLLIIAEDIDGEALTTLVLNKLRGGLSLCAVKAPNFGERRKSALQDIAVLSGATIVSEELGLSLESVGTEVLGNAKQVSVAKESTTITGGQGNSADLRNLISQLRRNLSEVTSDYERSHLEERIAKLAGGVAVIRVGAATESAMKEKKGRVEDAVHATRAAVAQGIVPGGGVALLRAIGALAGLDLPEDEKVGAQIVRRAAFAPLRAIADNCGKNGSLIAEKVFEQKGAHGYNGLTGQFCDLLEAGVIDPVMVTRSALKHAASVAGLLLSAGALIVEKPKKKKETRPEDGYGGDMDMM